MTDENQLKEWFDGLKTHQDDLNWLSVTLMDIARYLYYHNTNMAQAEWNEVKAAVAAMAPGEDGKKMSVAEAEKRAVTECMNIYGILKAQRDGIIEVLNAVKVRIRVLEGEKDNSPIT